MFNIQVQSRVVGGTGKQAAMPTVAVRLESAKVTIAELIAETVTMQIETLLAVYQSEPQQVEQALRRYLTQTEVAQQAGDGKVALPKLVTAPKAPRISARAEIEKAQQAFREGKFAVFVDGQQAEHIDEVVTLRADTKVTFLHLTPLVGG